MSLIVIDDDPAFSPHIGDWKLNAVDWPNPKGPCVAQRQPCGPTLPYVAQRQCGPTLPYAAQRQPCGRKVRVWPSGSHVTQPLRMYAAPSPKLEGPYVEQRSAPNIATGAQV